MPKCKKCGRKGLFFKVNLEGVCKDCEVLTEIEKRKQELDNDVNSLCRQAEEYNQQIELKSNEVQELENNRQKIYDNLKQQAEQAALANIYNEINALKVERDERAFELANVSEELKKYHQLMI